MVARRARVREPRVHARARAHTLSCAGEEEESGWGSGKEVTGVRDDELAGVRVSR